MDLRLGWSNPQKDILELIFDRLEDPLDLLQCQRVSHSWYSIAREFSSQNLRNRPPLIVFLDTTSGRNNDSSKGLVFYNCQSRNDCKFSLPDKISASWISGSSYGLVLSIQREKPCEIWLADMVSYAQIRLPDATGVSRPKKLRIVMAANPCSDPNCMILAIDPDEPQHLTFCKVGDSSWTKIPIDRSSLSVQHSCAAFYKGRFHVYYYRQQVLQTIDLTTSRVPEIATWKTRGWLGYCHKKTQYLLESSGELLLVANHVYPPGDELFIVHKLDYEKREWVKVDDLGNRALFVGYNNSTSVVVEEDGGGRIGGSIGCRANSIYFIDDSDCWHENEFNTLSGNRGVYDMRNREFKRWIPGVRPAWFRAPLSWICPEV